MPTERRKKNSKQSTPLLRQTNFENTRPTFASEKFIKKEVIALCDSNTKNSTWGNQGGNETKKKKKKNYYFFFRYRLICYPLPILL